MLQFVFSLSPVKVTCSILNLSTSYVGCLSVVLFAVIVSANANELTYFMVKVRVIMSSYDVKAPKSSIYSMS